MCTFRRAHVEGPFLFLFVRKRVAVVLLLASVGLILDQGSDIVQDDSPAVVGHALRDTEPYEPAQMSRGAAGAAGTLAGGDDVVRVEVAGAGRLRRARGERRAK